MLSYLIYLVAYRLLQYRVKVVRENLSGCFPDKDKKWLRNVEHRYYHYLSELLVEGFVNMYASPVFIKHHYRFTNRQLVDRYYEQGKTVVLMSAHYCNWEYMVSSLNIQLLHHGIGVGKPLDDKSMASYITKRRTRFGTQVVDQTDVRQHVSFFNANNVPCALMMLSDQSPSNPHRSYWTNFLGRDTAFLYGAEYFARKYNYPVIYYNVRRVKRGYYDVTFQTLCEDPSAVPQYSITEQYVRLLEKNIEQQPEYWLWSHCRWKLTHEGRILKNGKIKIIPHRPDDPQQ